MNLLLASSPRARSFFAVTAPDRAAGAVAGDSAGRRIRLALHYDGASFAGWQHQPDARTVQSELEAALARLIAQPVRVAAAGRTDRGVHATGQVVSFEVPRKWQPAELRRALNALLPADVWVAAAAEAEPGFHARFSATARGYVYRVATSVAARSPFIRRWCWPLGVPLELEALNACAAKLVGDHSFVAFAKSGQPERGDRCIVHRTTWRPWRDRGVEYHIVANRFLHHMVRYLVGSMIDVARGRRAPDDIDALLSGGADHGTSAPAPAEGLFLTRVYYPGDSLHEDVTTDAILP
jgi:tRNA pseudouridine38-40 synthase